MVIIIKRTIRAMSFFIILALCFSCLPFVVYADDNKLPEKFDPRESGKVTPVRQSPEKYDICWAYATIGAMEQSIVFSGLDNTSVDLSESSMVWFSAQSEKENVVPQQRYSTNYITSPIFAAARLQGIEYESDEPTLLNTPYLNPVSYSQQGVADYELEKVERITGDTKAIKEKLMEYGGAAVCYHSNTDHFSSDHKSYYQDEEKSVNHSVTVIGWDDNYSKDNFGSVKPESDGAWLVKSVWGTRNDDGFYWISYCESELRDFYFYKLQRSVSDNVYTHNKGNDKIIASAQNAVQAANVFTARDNESLEQVSFFVEGNGGEGTEYMVRIFKDVKGDSPVNGMEILEKMGTVRYDGYVTVKFPEHISFSKGDRFSVVVSLKSKNGNNYFVAESAACERNKGESYYFSEKNGWQDSIQTSFANPYINAYTSKRYSADVSDLKQKIEQYENTKGMQRAVEYAKNVVYRSELKNVVVNKAERLIEAAKNEHDNYVVITNTDEWNEFAKNVSGGSEYTDKIVMLESDLDFSNKEFVSAGTPEKGEFNGCFYGNGHVIKNIRSSSCGLFAKLGKYAIVRELVVQNSSFTGESAGGIAGICRGGTVISCGFYGELDAKNRGGIVGELQMGTISDCYFCAKDTHDPAGLYTQEGKYNVQTCFALSAQNANEAQRTAELLNTNGGKNVFTQRFVVSDDTIIPIYKDTNVVHSELNIENKSFSAWVVIILVFAGFLLILAVVFGFVKRKKRRKEKLRNTGYDKKRNRL